MSAQGKAANTDFKKKLRKPLTSSEELKLNGFSVLYYFMNINMVSIKTYEHLKLTIPLVKTLTILGQILLRNTLPVPYNKVRGEN